MPDLARIQAVYERYSEARKVLLDELGLKRKSNRDPLAEFSEWLVAALVDGIRSDNPVEPEWDVQTSDAKKIQVKYLANSGETWVNEHEIKITKLMDSYAIVIFEDLLPKAVIIFPAHHLAQVGERLHKRHGNLDKTLQFTQANYRQICEDVAGFRDIGVQLYLPPKWLLS